MIAAPAPASRPRGAHTLASRLDLEATLVSSVADMLDRGQAPHPAGVDGVAAMLRELQRAALALAKPARALALAPRGYIGGQAVALVPVEALDAVLSFLDPDAQRAAISRPVLVVDPSAETEGADDAR